MSITPIPELGQYPWREQYRQWALDTQAAAENATIAADQVHADVAASVEAATTASAAAIAAAGLVGAPAGEAVKAAVAPSGAANAMVGGVALSSAPQRMIGPVMDALRPPSTLQIFHEYSTSQIFRVSSVHEGKHVSWVLPGAHSSGEAYRPLSMVYAGACTDYKKDVGYIGVRDVATFGTWVTAPPATRYTTEVGAGFEVTVNVSHDGQNIRFSPYHDNRGGIWELSLLETTINPIRVSVWSATAGVVAKTVFARLPKGAYVLRAVFKGDDPDHAPTGGTARGWTAVDDVTTASRALLSLQDTFQKTSLDTLLSPMSNREFAFRIRPAGTSETAVWVPEHESTPTTTFVSPPQYFLDGKPFDHTTVPADGYYKGDTFSVIQNVVGRMPGSSVDLINITTTTIFKGDGSATVSGRWEILEPVEVLAAYVTMLPGVGSAFNRVTTSQGEVVANTAAKYGTSTWLPNDHATEYIFTSDSNPSRALSMEIHAPKQTIDPLNSRKPSAVNERTFVEHRNATVVKVYNKLVTEGTVLPQGTAGFFSATWTAFDWAPIAQAL